MTIMTTTTMIKMVKMTMVLVKYPPVFFPARPFLQVKESKGRGVYVP
jgi:hypothetical protein